MSILDVQTMKEVSQTRFKFYHFRPILWLETSVEQWLPGLLLWTPCLGGLENSLNHQFQKRKIELWSYHCQNYFFRLASVHKEEKQNYFFHNFKFLHDPEVKYIYSLKSTAESCQMYLLQSYQWKGIWTLYLLRLKQKEDELIHALHRTSLSHNI